MEEEEKQRRMVVARSATSTINKANQYEICFNQDLQGGYEHDPLLLHQLQKMLSIEHI